MKIESISPLVPNQDNTPLNPYHQDLSNMGQQLTKGIMLMYPMHGTEDFRFIILVDQITGERWQITR